MSGDGEIEEVTTKKEERGEEKNQAAEKAKAWSRKLNGKRRRWRETHIYMQKAAYTETNFWGMVSLLCPAMSHHYFVLP